MCHICHGTGKYVHPKYGLTTQPCNVCFPDQFYELVEKLCDVSEFNRQVRRTAATTR